MMCPAMSAVMDCHKVPAASHHQLAKDWLVRDGASYVENRELGTKRARAAILMELALPRLYLPFIRVRNWDCRKSRIFRGTSWRIPPHSTAYASKPKRAVTAAECRCRGSLPTLRSSMIPMTNSATMVLLRSLPAGAEHDPHLPQPKWYKDFAVDVEDADPNSMLNLYRKALSLRHNLMPQDTELQWLDEDRPSDVRDGADGQRGGVIAYRRSNGWASVTNFGEQPVELPQGEVILASGELTADGRLPQDTTAWLQL